MDPELGSGWSYFVENTEYTRHVTNNAHQEDVSKFQLLGNSTSMSFLGYKLRQ